MRKVFNRYMLLALITMSGVCIAQAQSNFTSLKIKQEPTVEPGIGKASDGGLLVCVALNPKATEFKITLLRTNPNDALVWSKVQFQRLPKECVTADTTLRQQATFTIRNLKDYLIFGEGQPYDDSIITNMGNLGVRFVFTPKPIRNAFLNLKPDGENLFGLGRNLFTANPNCEMLGFLPIASQRDTNTIDHWQYNYVFSKKNTTDECWSFDVARKFVDPTRERGASPSTFDLERKPIEIEVELSEQIYDFQYKVWTKKVKMGFEFPRQARITAKILHPNNKNIWIVGRNKNVSFAFDQSVFNLKERENASKFDKGYPALLKFEGNDEYFGKFIFDHFEGQNVVGDVFINRLPGDTSIIEHVENFLLLNTRGAPMEFDMGPIWICDKAGLENQLSISKWTLVKRNAGNAYEFKPSLPLQDKWQDFQNFVRCRIDETEGPKNFLEPDQNTNFLFWAHPKCDRTAGLDTAKLAFSLVLGNSSVDAGTSVLIFEIPKSTDGKITKFDVVMHHMVQQENEPEKDVPFEVKGEPLKHGFRYRNEPFVYNFERNDANCDNKDFHLDAYFRFLSFGKDTIIKIDLGERSSRTGSILPQDGSTEFATYRKLMLLQPGSSLTFVAKSRLDSVKKAFTYQPTVKLGLDGSLEPYFGIKLQYKDKTAPTVDYVSGFMLKGGLALDFYSYPDKSAPRQNWTIVLNVAGGYAGRQTWAKNPDPAYFANRMTWAVGCDFRGPALKISKGESGSMGFRFRQNSEIHKSLGDSFWKIGVYWFPHSRDKYVALLLGAGINIGGPIQGKTN